MNTTLQASRLLFAAAMIALGITGCVNSDFALAWQQIPVHSLLGYKFIANVCAIIEVTLGIGLLFKPTLSLTCRVTFAYIVLWLALLEFPAILHTPQDPGSWGTAGEIEIIAAGAWCLFATHSNTGGSQLLKSLVGSSGIRAARWLLVLALPAIGLEVIVDAVHYGDKVMQPWLQRLPYPMAWACLTGVGSFAACLGLLFGVWPRIAATLEAAMVGLIAVAYWAPVLYTGRTATTAFIISFLVAAGVWLVADTYSGISWFATGQPVWRIWFRGKGAKDYRKYGSESINGKSE